MHLKGEKYEGSKSRNFHNRYFRHEVLLSDDINLSHSLDSVPEDYEKIILTTSREEALNNVRLIPYYRFIFDRSDNRKKV